MINTRWSIRHTHGYGVCVTDSVLLPTLVLARAAEPKPKPEPWMKVHSKPENLVFGRFLNGKSPRSDRSRTSRVAIARGKPHTARTRIFFFSKPEHLNDFKVPAPALKKNRSPSALTDHLQVPLTASHRVRVHLTHVPAPVLLVYVLDVQIPRPVIVVGQRHPRVLGDDVVVDGQDRLGVHSNPRHLRTGTNRE